MHGVILPFKKTEFLSQAKDSAGKKILYLKHKALNLKNWENIETYSYWKNPLDFKFKDNPTSEFKRPDELKIAEFARYIFTQLGGKGYAIWNKEFISGNSIALKFYIDLFKEKNGDVFGVPLQIENLYSLRKIKPLPEDVIKNLQSLTHDVKNAINYYRQRELGSVKYFINQ